MKVFRVLLLLAAIAMALPLSSTATAGQTSVTVTFQQDQFLFDRLGDFDRVVLRDGDALVRTGEPMLPARQIRVAIPQGAEAVKVTVRSMDSRVLDGYFRIFPGQPPRPLDGSPPAAFVGPNEQFYRSSAAYPGDLARLDGQTDLAGQQMAVLTVYPLQYVPSTGRLILHREMEIIVETRPGRISGESFVKFTGKQRKIYQEMIVGMVVNPQDVLLDPPRREASKALPSGDFDHVVITTVGFTPWVEGLVEWHNRRGLRDTVVHVGPIYTNYSGADNPEKIRNFIIDANSTWGTMYFLIAGENGAVPFKERYYYYEDTPSDQYYADFDDDWSYEVFVGRISGSDSTQFSCAIDKILKYEQDPPLTNYPLDVLLIGMDLDASTHSENLKETIDGYIPSRFDVTKVYDSHGGDHEDNAIAALEDGQNLVNHSDHCNSNVIGLGYINHNGSMYNVDVDGLTNNDQTSNLVSTGCWANDMTQGGVSDGIAEHFVIYNPQQAGVSFTGNTRDGWYYAGSTSTLTSRVDREWWRSLFDYDKYILGQALADGKNRNHPNSDIWRHCVWTFNLLGEPAMPLWTDTPESMTASHPATAPLGSSSFLVHVESGGSDLEDAYVCLWKAGEVYLTDNTNSNGDASFTPAPAAAGSLFVTVTKHNYLPYRGSAFIGEETPSPVDDLAIALSQGDLILTWSSPETKAISRYVIYRSTESDFVPAPGDSIGGTADTTYLDPGAAGLVGTDYFYAVKAANGSGQKSDPSNIVGEYDIVLINDPSR
ncbi:C25 family cysteine peptidase [Candidatus Zixiibacteriota bacterium]